ncbi:MAG: sugar transferase [Lactobacillales bacterium]|nr:sugar transferase [Lactobacillales bacterium]
MTKTYEFSNCMKNEVVREYHQIIKNKKIYIFIKRILDTIFSLILIILFIIPMFIIALIIVLDDFGSPFYLQDRVTKNGKIFKIFKFRSMKIPKIENAQLITTKDDNRITQAGSIIRKYRLDELTQLFNILKGDMSFVGTRPEVPYYVEKYSEEMYATLLFPAGVTSLASIKFKNESEILDKAENIDDVYVEDILPKKMKYNFEYLRKFSFTEDILIVFKTVKEMFFNERIIHKSSKEIKNS